MTTLTLAAPARRPGALVAPQFDDRPCVTNDPRKWDVGNDGNAEAIRLCNQCPANNEQDCEIGPGVIRRGQAFGANLDKPLRICRACGHPRTRTDEGTIVCKCARNRVRTADEAVQEWLAAGGPDRSIGEVAADIGMTYPALRDALRRARRNGDPRVTGAVAA